MFLFLAGLLLLTGASVAGILRTTRDGMAATTQRVRRSTHEFGALFGTARTERLPEKEPVSEEPPEVEPVVRATHVELPPFDPSPRAQ